MSILYYRPNPNPMIIPRSFGLRKCGIYCITNTVNNKQYIGSSKNIYHRLKRHQSELRRGTHANPYLQSSYAKYGKESFLVSILEEIPENRLAQKEQEYIDNLKPVYNITLEVIRNTPSEESRRKISATLKRQKLMGLLKYPTHDDKKKPVAIYDTGCQCLGVYESERAAAKKLEELYPGIKHSQSVVNNVANLKGKKRKTKRYKNHYLLRPQETCIAGKRFRSDCIKIRVIDLLSNQEQVFPSSVEAGKVIGCDPNSILRALKEARPLLRKFKVIKHESS